MNLLDVVQEAIRQSLAAAQLTDLVTGTVTSADPLEIQADTTQAALKREVLVLTEAARDLASGDKVILLRVQHGQRFIVLSRAY